MSTWIFDRNDKIIDKITSITWPNQGSITYKTINKTLSSFCHKNHLFYYSAGRVVDSLFKHHLRCLKISWRYPPISHMYSTPSEFKMSQIILTCHFLRAALSSNTARTSLYRGVSFELLRKVDTCIEKTNVWPFPASFSVVIPVNFPLSRPSGQDYFSRQYVECRNNHCSVLAHT